MPLFTYTMIRKTFLLYGLLLAGCAQVCAQSAGKGKAGNKKPLRFRTTWGIFLSDTLPRPEVVKLLDSSLVVRDQQNNKYPVVSFDLIYEQKEPYLNDTTGRPAFYTEYIGDSFRSDKLSPLWSSRLKEMLSTGEVLLFDNIIIRYPGEKEDKYYKVPEVRIVVR